MDKNIQFVSLPRFNLMGIDILRNFCKINWLDIILAIFPATFVIISENITKITLIEKIMRVDKNTQNNNFANFYRQSMSGHSVSFLTSILLGAVPNAIYAENIALMEINNIEDSNKHKIIKERDNNIEKYYNKLSNYPLIIAGCLSIFFSFFTFFQTILTSILSPVYGGMKLFIFALISAKGVQLLVDRKVNYKKVTNQILTSITLLAGLSNISIDLEVTQISGLSLAFLVGVVVNLVFNLLSYMGLINEKLNMIDVIEICYSIFNKQYPVIVKSNTMSTDNFKQYIRDEDRTEWMFDSVNNITKARIVLDENKKLKIKKKDDKIVIKTKSFLRRII